MPWYEISNNVVCATSKGSDQPAYTHSLIRAFASCLNILWLLSYWPNILSKLKRGLHRLVRVYTCHNATLFEFTCRGSNVICWSRLLHVNTFSGTNFSKQHAPRSNCSPVWSGPHWLQQIFNPPNRAGPICLLARDASKIQYTSLNP